MGVEEAPEYLTYLTLGISAWAIPYLRYLTEGYTQGREYHGILEPTYTLPEVFVRGLYRGVEVYTVCSLARGI